MIIVRRAAKAAIVAAFGVVAADIATTVWYRAAVRDFVSRAVRDSARYDAAVVFFGARDDSGQLSPETMARVQRAATLFQSGRVRAVISVGGARPDWPRTGAQIMTDSLRRLGVPNAALANDSTSYDSVTNLAQADTIARRRAFSGVLLVSSPTHLYRLQRIRSDVAQVGFDAGVRAPSAGWWLVHREMFALLAFSTLPNGWYVSLVHWLRQGASS